MNIVFVKYYNLLRQKWSAKQAIAWIFSLNNSGKRYSDCIYWSHKWEIIFKQNNLETDIETLEKFFKFISTIYFNSEYPPSVSTIFSIKRINHFKIFYRNNSLDNYLYKTTLRKVAFNSLQKSENDLFEIKETINKSDLYRFKSKNGNLQEILYVFCIPNNLFYKKNNKICIKCFNRNLCKIR